MEGGTGSGPIDESYRGYDVKSQDIYDEVISHLERVASEKNRIGRWQNYFFYGDNTQIVRIDPEKKRVELSADLDTDIVRGIEEIIIDKKGDVK